MDEKEALKLLRGGRDGVKEWNARRDKNESIPSLTEADLSGNSWLWATRHVIHVVQTGLRTLDHPIFRCTR